MNILFYRYGSICEPDLIEQFNSIGFTVDCIENEINNKQITSKDRIALLDSYLANGQYLFVFSINFFPSISQLCQIYKIKYVCWSVDSPVDELFSMSISNDCNRIFLFDKSQYQYLADNNINNIYYLPLGTNEARWNKVISSIPSEEQKIFSADISFVGSLYTERNITSKLVHSPSLSTFMSEYTDFCNPEVTLRDVASRLTDESISELKVLFPTKFYPSDLSIMDMDRYCALYDIIGFSLASTDRINLINRLSKTFNVNLYTRSDAGSLTPSPNLKIFGGVSTLSEMPLVFNLSKINLNITIPSIESGIPLRCWDILGCGGFLMTNYQAELEDYLVCGKDYECYYNLEDLVEKCSFYLEHDDIRIQIARSGHDKVAKYHTYINRMPALIKSVL